MIVINRNILTALIILLTALAVISSLFFVEKSLVISAFTFLYFVTIPGLVILYSLRLNHLGFWQSLVLSVGLSLSVLLLPGLVFNWIWFQLSHYPPLQKELLLSFYGIFTLIFLIIAYFRNKQTHWKIKFHFKNIYFILPPLITLLSVFGAFQLNNSSSNVLAVTAYVGMIVILFFSLFFHNKINDHFFPWSIYCFSLSLLLSISLRSNYISGWDIQTELKMFQVTREFGVWNAANWNHAYNACLSITLLPTIISQLTKFPDDYIYKFLYQILFAITPVVVFLNFKKYASTLISYLSIIYIISQPLFIQPMTALMRQEIAYIFFALLLFVLFNYQITNKIRYLLFILFGICMIVSHYSTTYITLILLVLTYPAMGLFRILEYIPFFENIFKKIQLTSDIKFYNYYLNPILLIVLFAFTFYWYGYVNNQLGQVQRVAQEGFARMNELFNTDVSIDESKQAITFLEKNSTTAKELDKYTKEILEKVDGDSWRLYNPSLYKNSNVVPLSPAFVKPLYISRNNKYIIFSLELLKQIFKICIMLGPLYAFIFYFKKTTLHREYILLSGIGVLIVAVMTFHPTLGLEYGLSRFYLQLLFFLSLPAILLIYFLLSPLKKATSISIGIFVILLFGYLTGIIYQFIGGEARIYLNNYGEDYDKFYVHKEELVSAQWLNKKVKKEATVYADQESYLRITRVFDRSYNRNILPALIYKDAYLYASYANIVSGIGILHQNGNVMIFSFPKVFLEQNKNVIYSNGSSQIYK